MSAAEKIVIGITGGIGSGKTVATDALKNLGYFVIDADEISRALFARGTDGEQKLCAIFPEAAEGTTLNRRALRELISRDKTAREKLNDFTHPIILTAIKNDINSADVSPVILSAPLLFETELFTLCDATITVTCPVKTRITRITARDNITEAQAEAIISAQMTDEERTGKADFVVDSDCEMNVFIERIVSTIRNV